MPSRELPRDVGLCLSGGGYRAAVFHLGSLLRLNEAHLLLRVGTHSSRLAPLSPEQQHRLINWGYALCDAAIRRYIVDAARGNFPYPGGVG